MECPENAETRRLRGYARQDYDDPRLVDVSSPVAGAALLWSVAPRTTVSAYLDRTVKKPRYRKP